MSSVVLSKVEKKNFYLYPENPTFKKFLTKEAKEVYTSIMGYSFFFLPNTLLFKYNTYENT